MNETRRRLLAKWRTMTPAQRLAESSRMTAVLLAQWNARLRRQHPLATEDELRAIRLANVLSRCEEEKAQRDVWFAREAASAS